MTIDSEHTKLWWEIDILYLAFRNTSAADISDYISDYKMYRYFVRNKAKTFNFLNFKVQNKVISAVEFITNISSVYRLNRPSPSMVNVIDNVIHTEHHYTLSPGERSSNQRLHNCLGHIRIRPI